MLAETAQKAPLDRVVVALDTADWETFRRWCTFFGRRVGALKIGLEAFVRWGPKSVEVAREEARAVFLDLKLHDIPHTVAGAVRSVRSLGADLLTVHAAGGAEMLQAAVEAADDRVRILAVTVLTHLDEQALARLDLPGRPVDRVLGWTTLARDAGLGGAVCSPREVAAVRRKNPPPFLLVTPGVRPAATVPTDDQKRTATPVEAIEHGADLLVIGRPLTRAPDPGEALTLLETSLREMR